MSSDYYGSIAGEIADDGRDDFDPDDYDDRLMPNCDRVCDVPDEDVTFVDDGQPNGLDTWDW